MRQGFWLFGLGMVAIVTICGAGETVNPMEIYNAEIPLEDVMTAGQPTREQLEAIAAAGYKTVVNLRPVAEEGAWDETEFVEGLGMKYVHLPIAGRADITADNAKRLAEILEGPDAKPILIHCKTGGRVKALLNYK